MARKPNAAKALAKNVKLPVKKAEALSSEARAEKPVESAQQVEAVSVEKTTQNTPVKKTENTAQPKKVARAPKKTAGKGTAAKTGPSSLQVGFQGYGDLAALGKDNIDACVQSSTVVAKGMEEVSKELIGYARSCLATNMQATQAFLEVHSLKEAMDLQADFTRKNFDSWMAESAKLGDLSAKLASEVIEPIQGRVTKTVERVIKSAA